MQNAIYIAYMLYKECYNIFFWRDKLFRVAYIQTLEFLINLLITLEENLQFLQV